MQRAFLISCLSLVLVGCQALPGSVAPTPAGAATAPAESAPAAPALRGLTLRVRGPADLVRASGVVIADDLVAAGAGNLSASTDGVLSHNGGALVAAVDGATCHCETLDGVHVGPVATSDAAGEAGFPPMPPSTEPAVAVAHFRVAGQMYRVTALVPAGGPTSALVLDPISTMIEAVAHEAARREPGAAILAQASMARIREICERHGLSADADDLVFPATAESSAEGLRDYWNEEVEEHVTDPRDRAELDAFTRTLAALGRD